jgi:hypothetical protein
MTPISGKQIARAAARLTLALLALEQLPSAEGQCHQVKATYVDVWDGGCCTDYGTITQGGMLNGTTVTVGNPVANPTPDPNVVSWAGEFTITTHEGELRSSNAYLWNFVTQQGTAIGRINPDTSTGNFAKATGVLFLNLFKTVGTSPPVSYLQEVTGEICLTKQ